jgi:hypothetical protein
MLLSIELTCCFKKVGSIIAKILRVFFLGPIVGLRESGPLSSSVLFMIICVVHSVFADYAKSSPVNINMIEYHRLSVDQH